MSAVAERTRFAAIGRDLIAARGDAGARRAAALLGRPTVPSCKFADLAVVPDWLRWDGPRRAMLARAVALRALAATLATSIDGAWLGAIARVAGEDALDWAIGIGGESEPGGDVPAPIPAERLEAAGAATLQAMLPAALRGYFALTSGEEPLVIGQDDVRSAIRFVKERTA